MPDDTATTAVIAENFAALMQGVFVTAVGTVCGDYLAEGDAWVWQPLNDEGTPDDAGVETVRMFPEAPNGPLRPVPLV